MQLRIDTDKPYRIFAEAIEQGALDQFASAMQQSFTTRGALMPDAHQGYSLPIGAVVETEGVVVPAWVGYDIGCGMCALETTFDADQVRERADAIFDGIYAAIPTGLGRHNHAKTDWPDGDALDRTPVADAVFSKNGLYQLGSLGAGNHFIEVGEDEQRKVWIVIHSGSRGVGHAVATHYMRLASGNGKAREGHFGFDASGSDGRDYVADLNFCLAFALANRREMMLRIVGVINSMLQGSADWGGLINRNHNHAEKRGGRWIHRKGATHAEDGMMGVIPGNMRDGSFIVRGRGNAEALWSSSHGAGRVLGRKEAKRTLEMADFAETMDGIKARVDADTLDESPFAYKDIFEVMRQQEGLVEVVAHVRPILNVKG